MDVVILASLVRMEDLQVILAQEMEGEGELQVAKVEMKVEMGARELQTSMVEVEGLGVIIITEDN